MRTRAEIEAAVQHNEGRYAPSASTAQLLVEVLLDIRDLLLQVVERQPPCRRYHLGDDVERTPPNA